MTTVDEIMRQAIFDATNADVSIQPGILLNRNISPERITDIVGQPLGDEGSDARKKIISLIREGWVFFRIQTEFGLSGHHTVAYLVKLKEP
jgi:hypothetical protein